MNIYLWVYCMPFFDAGAIGRGLAADIRWSIITYKWKKYVSFNIQ